MEGQGIGGVASLAAAGSDHKIRLSPKSFAQPPRTPMTLTGLIARYVRQNWRPYLLAALMLASVSALTVFIPRQVGHIVDGLAAGRLDNAELVRQLGWLVLAGVLIYFLRVAWRLQLFAASYRLGAELR